MKRSLYPGLRAPLLHWTENPFPWAGFLERETDEDALQVSRRSLSGGLAKLVRAGW